ncbi:MAG: hypothetical protein Q8N73_02390 [bacterium]|nr:hypothetical protein [bacterium]
MQKSKLQFKIQKLGLLAVIFIFSFLFFNLNGVEAARLNFVSQIQEIGINQQFQVDLMLDTEGEVINAIEGEIVFPKELLEIREIRDGDSIINLWIERPAINQTGRVIFSGIIPTGFEGVLSPYYEGYGPGKIFSLIFISKKEGEGTIDFENGKVLLHDGLGTPANVKISNFQFLISKQIPISELQIPGIEDDTDSPEEFKPEITKDSNIFDNKWFLVFLTQDKGSGIGHYEVHETTRKKDITRIAAKNWTEAESPYVLKDQKLKSYICVKAVDKVGNERIAVVEPRYPIKWYELWWIWVIIILGLAVAYLVRRFLWQKFIKSR